MRISEISSDVNSISGNITSTLQQEASLITSADYFVEELDMAAGTAKLVCELLPKEYTEGKTTVSVVYDEKEYSLAFENGTYRGKVPIRIFDEVHIESAIMREGNITRTETMDWYISPRYDYLPMVYADMGSSYTSHTKDGNFILGLMGDVNYSMDVKSESAEDEAAYFYACLDGKEIERVKITDGRHYNFSKDYEIPFGSTLIFYVEVIDSYGLHHRTILEYFEIDSDGQRVYDENEWEWRGSVASIYDAEGHLLHSEHPESEF